MTLKCILHPRRLATAIFSNYGLCQDCSEVIRGDCGAEVSYTITRKINKTLTKDQPLKTKVNFVRNHSVAQTPTRAHGSDAGNDLYAIEDVQIQPRTLEKIDTGLAIELPEGTVGLIKDRSSMGFKKIHVFAGVIDSSYRGEVGVLLYNASDKVFTIKKGERIAQLLVQDVYNVEWNEVKSLDQTDRGSGGFGSSNK